MSLVKKNLIKYAFFIKNLLKTAYFFVFFKSLIILSDFLLIFREIFLILEAKNEKNNLYCKKIGFNQ